MIDYFAPATTVEEKVLRRVKGNFRRKLVLQGIRNEGFESVPDVWKSHNLPGMFKDLIQRDHPQNRGGEDLPDLEEGEVEIARLTLADSVHGEVTSLRARRLNINEPILLSMVDEYDSNIALPRDSIAEPLTETEVIELFKCSDPSPMDTECAIEFQSFFYPELNKVAQKMGYK